ncbi:hypothetical protein Tco_0020340 [Tanacetum coccineum]
MLLIYEVTFLDPYSVATLFGGVTDWYLEPSRHWVSDDELEAPEEAPPSPDYMPGPKHPSSLDYMPGLEHPSSPNYVPELEYPEYLVPSDAEVPIEDQPLPVDALPTTYHRAMLLTLIQSPQSEEDDDEEEVEHLAPADSFDVPAIDPVPSAEDTEIPSPPLPVPSLLLPLPSPPTHTSPSYADAPLGYRVARIRLRAASPPLLLLSTTHQDDIPEVDMPLRKRARFTAPASGFEVGETLATATARQPGLDITTVDATPRRPMSREDGYGIKDVYIAEVERARHARTGMIDDEDRLTRHIQHDHDWFLELVRIARDPEPARDPKPQDGPADAYSSCYGNGDDSHDSRTGGRRQVPTARECTYNDFLKFQPLNFKGTKGVVGLTQWFEKIEYVFHLSNCTVAVGIMYGRMFPEESDEVEKYIKRFVLLLNVNMKTKESLMTTQEANKINNNLSKGKLWQGPTLLGLGRREHAGDLNLCALNVTTIMMGSVLPSVPTARGLAIWPVTVEASLLLPTTREPHGKIKGFSLALSVELRATTKGIARS